MAVHVDVWAAGWNKEFMEGKFSRQPLTTMRPNVIETATKNRNVLDIYI